MDCVEAASYRTNKLIRNAIMLASKRQISNLKNKRFLRLHWKIFFPVVILMWFIIGLTIFCFVHHENLRMKQNLENRLLNVNNTVIEAYNRGDKLQRTVNFVRLFIDNTTLAPLRLTVYDNDGNMIADNPEETLLLYDENGNIDPDIADLLSQKDRTTFVKEIPYKGATSMLAAKQSADGRIVSLAALPYDSEVQNFVRTDPMVWLMVIFLGILTSIIAYFGARAVCKNIYNLRDYASAIAEDRLPDNPDDIKFSKDELGDVSRYLMSIYREKITAEQEKMHHERRVTMNISHELKTPVTIIKGYIDTVLSSPDMPDEMRDKFLHRIKDNTDRLAILMRDVTLIMSLGENEKGPNISPVNIHTLGLRIAEDVAQGNIAEGMTFHVDIPENINILGNESLLTNAILNLINNAYRYSEGDSITLRYDHTAGNMAYFEFYDNGVGVKPEHFARLFDLFYRVDNGRARKNGGSGLGLPMVKRVITLLGGTIKVEDAQPTGLKFVFSLPVAI